MTLGVCAKRRVFAVATGPNGQVAFGENLCRSPQPTCPRQGDEGYEKCKTICQQIGHGEEVALRVAEHEGWTPDQMVVFGHYHACGNCKRLMKNVGIRSEQTFFVSTVPAKLPPLEPILDAYKEETA